MGSISVHTFKEFKIFLILLEIEVILSILTQNKAIQNESHCKAPYNTLFGSITL
jgi:hypothetical protein